MEVAAEKRSAVAAGVPDRSDVMKKLKETAAPSPSAKKYKAPTGRSVGRPP